MFYKMLYNIHIFNSSIFSKGFKMGIFLAHLFSEKSFFFPKTIGLIPFRRSVMSEIKILGQKCEVKFFKTNDIKKQVCFAVVNKHGKVLNVKN